MHNQVDGRKASSTAAELDKLVRLGRVKADGHVHDGHGGRSHAVQVIRTRTPVSGEGEVLLVKWWERLGWRCPSLDCR